MDFGGRWWLACWRLFLAVDTPHLWAFLILRLENVTLPTLVGLSTWLVIYKVASGAKIAIRRGCVVPRVAQESQP